VNKKLVKILLVDDDPADRKLAQLALKSGLQSVDFVIDIAETLTQAMVNLKKNGVDLVLLDLGLPDSNGIETVDRLRDAHSNIPIIVLTGLSDEEIGVEAIRRGAVDYVTKPFKPSGLRTRIGIALQIVELQKRLLLLANTDELTGLANRRHFFDILDREILRAKIDGSSLAVMMLDIDHFKSANDTYGHRGGDEILAQMGKILQENIYPLDVAARYGGEEFIILMPNTSSEKAYQAAERLRKIVDQYQWKVFDKTISITTSIGLASIDSKNLMSSYDLAEKADTALYDAKRKGRNCVVCWENVNSEQEPEQPDDRVYHELQNKVASLSRKLRSHAVGTISAFTRAMDMIFKDRYIVRHGESITIPESILKKTTPLTKEEKRIIKQHPNASVEILEPVGIFNLELQIIKGHHERFDGAGYPNGLKGREIPIGSRILAVADTFDAITSQREHRQAQSAEAAIEEIVRCSGTQFDPDVVEAFKKVVKGPLAVHKCSAAAK